MNSLFFMIIFGPRKEEIISYYLNCLTIAVVYLFDDVLKSDRRVSQQYSQ